MRISIFLSPRVDFDLWQLNPYSIEAREVEIMKWQTHIKVERVCECLGRAN